jgi:L-2,4-diaminobutyric acid acetyltransferase
VRPLRRISNSMTDSTTDDISDITGTRRAATRPRRAFQFTRPTESDGAAIYSLVRDGGTLELNSAYAYLLMGAHFGDTSVIARDVSVLCGFVWAYRLPQRPNTLFVWQIGVAPDYRGHGLGHALLSEALARPAGRDVTHLEATVTPSNDASMALFRGFGRRCGAPVALSMAFDANLFPDPAHETEMLVRIGPFHQIVPAR